MVSLILSAPRLVKSRAPMHPLTRATARSLAGPKPLLGLGQGHWEGPKPLPGLGQGHWEGPKLATHAVLL